MTQPIKVYKAVVTSVSGRDITVKTSILYACDLLVKPLYDGLLKLPAPAVDSEVLVLDPLGTGTYRYYIPLSGAFSELTDDSTKIQIEGTGLVEVEGSTILLGAGATELVALSNLVKAELDKIVIAVTSILSHTHTVTGAVPSGPDPVVASTSLNIGSGYTASEVACTKVKAE